MELSDYRLEMLRQDEEFILFRGRHRHPGKAGPPTILVVTPRAERPAPASLQRMEQEYALRADLDPGWAAEPLALVSRDGRVMLVLADPGGEPLDQRLGRPLELTLFLRLAVGLSVALGRLHGRGLIHKDVKPANTLVDGARGQVCLTGFGIASRLPRQRQPSEPPEFIAGTLAYMAPEQTGRMNRSVDSRSDLYALGVTLYESLTGRLPFTASDPMGWVHCHIAKQPVPPAERVTEVPRPVSAIIMKLLAKTPEERYQTAAGVESDLRRCQAQWEAERRIDEFALGQSDRPDRLLIPEKLYGRECEIETLLAAFDRVVRSGTPELVLVSGYSGIGKSSVVNELHKVLVPPRGLFGSGKFDQYKRDIPYSTLAQAFRSLIRPLLGKSDAELAAWRDALQRALGPNARLIVDLVPEVQLIIGEPPPVPELPPQDARRRFQLVFRRFIGVFARPEHPLALFLDDLQWLDSATLDLIEDLLTQPDVQHLLLIGAYRDNEVDASHPLQRKLDTIRQAKAAVQEITLAPLARDDLAQLVAAALRCEPPRAAPLAQVVHEKTGGNPFFAIQFLCTLAEEKLLVFDHDKGDWSWDLDHIHAKGYTDNVVELMVGKLGRLPVETQMALQKLACLGNIAGVTPLCIILGTSVEQVHAALWEAVRLELVERTDGSYKFAHDRVQEAAYSLIAEEFRAETHLRIGRLLLSLTPREQHEETIFEIVNQLNRGVTLITEPGEREQLAELNLLAGKRAKASTAYESALTYLATGATLLADDCWESGHQLCFALELNRAECEFLTGRVAAAEERLSMLSLRAAHLVEKAAVAALRIRLYTALGRSDRGIEIGLEYLREVGIVCSPRPTDEEVRQEYERLCRQLQGRPIESLLELPLLSDPDWRNTMEFLADFIVPAFFTDAELFSLMLLRMANLSIEHGNSDASCIAYAYLHMTVGPRFGNYQAGDRLARVGCDLVEKKGLDRFKTRVYAALHTTTIWTHHVRNGRPQIRRDVEMGMETGDLMFAAFSYNDLVTSFLACGDPLEDAQREAECGLNFTRRLRFGSIFNLITAQLGFIRNLRGLTRAFGSFDDDEFDERDFERHLEESPSLETAACWYFVRKLQAHYFAGDYSRAVAAADRAKPFLWTAAACFHEAEYHFYGALARAGTCERAAPETRRRHLEALAENQKQLTLWADNCPENFENRAALVAGEIARLEGRELDAERLYEQAIRSARAHGFVQNEALAYERASAFYRARGFEQFADLYLRNARYGYMRWGADGKVRQLDQLYPQLREEQPAPGPHSTMGTPFAHLELATVLKISQAVSGEIVREQLIETLLRTALEHAGAQRGLLLLPRGGDLSIQAAASTSGSSVIIRLHEAPASPAELPESVARYAARTQEPVVLNDASTSGLFSGDEYVRRQHARSILCLPLVKQGRLVALLYLENNLAAGVFTPARIAVLSVLASQAAMSLENSRLYRELQEREAKIRRLVDANIVGVIISDLEGRIIEANDAFLDMTGYTRDDLTAGRLRWSALTPPEWQGVGERAVSQLRATGTCEVFEKEFLRSDGSRVPVLVGAAAIGETGSEYVAFVLDITQRKRGEEALRRSQAAEAANRAKDEFLANVSHELRTPMNAILGMTERALDTELTDEQRQYLKTVKLAGNHLLGLLNDLLDFSKLEAGKLELDLADFSLRRVVGDTLRVLAVRAHRKGIELISHLQPDVPDALVGDAGRLGQVLLNLVGNAIKFTEQGEVVVRVEVAPTSLPDVDLGLHFSVTDTGIGIAPEKQEAIFRAFEQEDASTTRKYGGTGLGLTIAARLVALMGGIITVQSAPGRGSTFTFTARFGRRPCATEPAARPPVMLHDLPVLVVDDNVTNRRILEEWLRGWWMRPTAVGDGPAALDALCDAVSAGRPYPLVLLDACMPDTDGLTLAAKIRRRAELAAARIILLTSDVSPGDRDRVRELRIGAHLLKPVQQDELLEAICPVMGRSGGDAPPAARPTAEQEPAPAPAPLRVLVAEDNEFNALLLEKLLARRGHRVRLAVNGREALRLVAAGGYDLLLLDVHMPELDGFQVARAVRERERVAGGRLPIIALTARARNEDRELCLAAGMDDFLAKPIQAADLWAALDRAVADRPPEQPTGPGLIDSRVLLAACGEDAAILEKLCEALKAGLPDQVSAVEGALRAGDAPRLRAAAHRLWGMVAAFSSAAGGVASEIEDDAAAGRLEPARPLVERLAAMARELIRLAGRLSLDALRYQAGSEAGEAPIRRN